ncbi:hypothetical protein AZI86_03200 [Bdellovibrio bacteriovorus]|uniref:P/Homo B domain-containing protein n=1 Tax=Bdellovibrio bacteriovorus TaxID=959 RepID=A0A150WP53_BDEBC|nr:S8 family serine peptidase [Bdellovibrio bacteriovorus]KYG66087.1 hypothetical protein AZI86_03200 [Bdellovibrio bacteriovorus]
MKRSALVGLALLLSSCTQSFEVDPKANTPITKNPTTISDPEEEDAGVVADFTAYQDVTFNQGLTTTLTSSPQFTVTNKPSWLTLDTNTGTMSGTPTTTGVTYDVTFTVTDSNNATETLGPYIFKVTGDTYKKYQWHLTNTGQSAFAGRSGTAGQDIHLTNTIASGLNGSGIKIAISDTGIQEAHPGLKNSLIAGASRNYLLDYSSTNWIGDSTPDTSEADNAHGTGVAGLAAERGWKGFGGRGVAPRASVAGFMFLPAQEDLFIKGRLTQALINQYQGDFDIFNFSWGDLQCELTEYDASYKYASQYGVTNARAGKGALYVKAAGNDFTGPLRDCVSSASSSAYFLGNSNFSEDSGSPYMIVVGALNAKGTSSSYSSPGANLWVSAPGGEFGYSTYSNSSSVALDPALLTTDFVGCNLGLKKGSNNTFDQGQSPNTNCEYTATMNGTSGASPIVSGAIALILQANPALSWRDVKHILASTSDQVAPTSINIPHPSSSGALAGVTYEPGWTTNDAGYRFHNWYGFGRINVDAAVTMAKTYTSSLGIFKQTNTTDSSSIAWKYDSGSIAATVTGGTAAGTTRTLNVTESYVIEGVQVKLNASSCIGNLGVELTSPKGTKSVIMNINSYLQDSSMNHTFLTNMFYGEDSQGTWTLKLIAAKSGCNTTWNSWQLNILGH